MALAIMPNALLFVPRSLRAAMRVFVLIVVYLVTLNVGLNVALAGWIKDWTYTSRDRLTVTLPASARDNEVARVLAILAQNPDVARAIPMPPAEVRDLIAPLIQDDATRRTLPLPRLIAVVPREGAIIEAERLRKTIENDSDVREELQVDSHATWLARDDAFLATVLSVAWGSVGLLAGILVLGVVLSTRSLLAGQRETVELLRLLGAPRTFIRTIAVQIVRRITLLTILSGWLLAVATLVGIGILFVDRLAIPALGWMRIEPAVTIAALVAVPFFAALLAFLAARFDLGYKR